MCLYICECDYVNVYMQHSCNYIFHILLKLEVVSSKKVVIMVNISLLQIFEILSCCSRWVSLIAGCSPKSYLHAQFVIQYDVLGPARSPQ